jgi:hypothetical protein
MRLAGIDPDNLAHRRDGDVLRGDGLCHFVLLLRPRSFLTRVRGRGREGAGRLSLGFERSQSLIRAPSPSGSM